MRCSLGQHKLVNGCHITEPHYVHFVQRVFAHFRPQSEVCLRCRNSVIHMYKKKARHLREKLNSVNVDSTRSTSSEDSITRLVEDGKFKNLRTLRSSASIRSFGIENQPIASPKDKTTQNLVRSSSSSLSNIASLGQLANSESVSAEVTNGSSLASKPTTSSKATKKISKQSKTLQDDKIKSNIVRPVSVTADSDTSSEKGINVLNGSRLPHIQPVPRRQPFTSESPEVMEIYLQGTTGG